MGHGLQSDPLLFCSRAFIPCDGPYVFHSVFIHLAQLQRQRLGRYPQLPPEPRVSLA